MGGMIAQPNDNTKSYKYPGKIWFFLNNILDFSRKDENGLKSVEDWRNRTTNENEETVKNEVDIQFGRFGSCVAYG